MGATRGRAATAPARVWSPLTSELADGRSPVRGFVDGQLGTTTGVCRRHRDAAGALLVPAGGANPGTVGTAFDFALRLLFDPVPNLYLPALGAHPMYCGPPVAAAFGRLVDELGGRVDADTKPVTEPLAAPVREPELLLRAAWAMALLTEVFRRGELLPQSPLAQLAGSDRPVDLLSLATPAAVTELGTLVEMARGRLLPQLATRPAPWYIGPTFAGSTAMPADADLIAGGLLLEVKTVLGSKRVDGSRRSGIEPATFRQLLGYALLDFDDEYGVRDLGLYDARYGHLSVWPIADLLAETTGRPVDIAAARRDFRTLLTGAR